MSSPKPARQPNRILGALAGAFVLIVLTIVLAILWMFIAGGLDLRDAVPVLLSVAALGACLGALFPKPFCAVAEIIGFFVP